MNPSTLRAWDVLPVIPATVALTVTLGYVRLMDDQGDEPVMWFITGLALAGAASIYGTWRRAPMRAVALAAAGTILVGFGVLALSSVGFPLLVAGAVALFAATRTAR